MTMLNSRELINYKIEQEPNLDGKIFDLNLSNLRDTVYIFAKRYSEPNYKLQFTASNCNYIKDGSGRWVKMNSGIDCFGFVLLVLKDLARYGFIDFPHQKKIVNVIDLLRNALNKGILIEVDSWDKCFENSLCGLFFYTKSSIGWGTKGCRHLGFYFVFDNQITLVHNTLFYGEYGGVVEEKYSKVEFNEFIQSKNQFYLTK